MKKARWLLLGSYALLGVLVPLSAVSLLSWDELPKQHLNDGSVVRLTTLQFGTTNPVVYGPAWKRRLFPLPSTLPQGMGDLVRCETFDPRHLVAPGALLLGLDQQGGADHVPPRGVLIDRHGCRFNPLAGYPGRTGGNLTNLEAFVFYPRREPTFQFQILPKGTTPEPAFAVSNPTGTQYPVWQAEPLPRTQRSGPLEVTLDGISEGWSAEDRLRGQGEVAVSRVDYRLPEQCREWQPMGLRLTDAMGGTSYLGIQSELSTEHAFYIPGSYVCREEPAYRYDIEFSRHGPPDARPDQFFDLGTGDLSEWKNRTCTLPGGRQVKVELEVSKLHRYLRITWPGREGERARLWIHDLTLGRIDTIPRVGIPGGAWNHGATWSVLPATRRLKLRLGVYKTRTVSFTVKPRWVEGRPVAPGKGGRGIQRSAAG